MAATTQSLPLVQPQLVFLDGSFEDLALEMAEYLKASDAVKPLVERGQKEEVIAKLVANATALNSAPEKEFTAASNLLIYLVFQATDPRKYLQSLCGCFAKPLQSSPVNGVGLSLNGLTTIFNLLPPENPIRARVLMEILKFQKQHGMFEALKPYLPHLEAWIETWGTDEELQRNMYTEIAEVAMEAGHPEESYQYVLRALRTFDADDREELTSEEAQKLALRAVRMALMSNTLYLFQDLRDIPCVEALNDSHPVYAQLLEIFAEQDLEDFNDFNDEHEGWIEQQKLDMEKLTRKMRLLSFASLAASTPSREIEHAKIVKALQIPEEDVEMWTIDAIRAGLVEGKLSQQRKVFLVHKITYRVFGSKQWQELATRVHQWRSTLINVLQELIEGRDEAKAQQERDAQEAERKANQAATGGPGGRGGGGRNQPRQPKERTDNDD
jgi:translation initiation factor 3 subunit M